MKNTYTTSKTVILVLSIFIAALVIGIVAYCTMPYFFVEEVYHAILNKNPGVNVYSFNDLLWTDTKDFIDFYSQKYEFQINNFVMLAVLNHVFGLCAIISMVIHARGELKRYPNMASGICSGVFSILWGVCGVLGFLPNALFTDTSTAKESLFYVRETIWLIAVVGTVLAVARTVLWLTVTIKMAKEKKARLALL